MNAAKFQRALRGRFRRSNSTLWGEIGIVSSEVLSKLPRRVEKGELEDFQIFDCFADACMQ